MLKSINEPDATREFMLTPPSINEPPEFEQPSISALEPDSCVSGDPDFTLYISGTGFGPETVIVFGDYDEPTTLHEDGRVSTIVKPSLFAPAVVPVKVRNGPKVSDPVDFTFNAPA